MTKVGKEQRVLEKAWSEEQYQSLRSLNQSQWVDTLLVISWEAGLRPAEAMGLRNDHIDTERSLIHLKGGKTGPRTIPLSTNLAKYLEGSLAIFILMREMLYSRGSTGPLTGKTIQIMK